MNDGQVVLQTLRWVDSVVIDLDLCPFAQREMVKDRIRCCVSRAEAVEDALIVLVAEAQHLDREQETETTLIVYPCAFEDFDAFLAFLDAAERVLRELGYEGIYQLASFHPRYRFAGEPAEDPANYTNRSPYPMLHLLRETSVELAIAGYPQPEEIPARNIGQLRQRGAESLQAMLDACYVPNAPDDD